MVNLLSGFFLAGGAVFAAAFLTFAGFLADLATVFGAGRPLGLVLAFAALFTALLLAAAFLAALPLAVLVLRFFLEVDSSKLSLPIETPLE